jgi:hypothetical protein
MVGLVIGYCPRTCQEHAKHTPNFAHCLAYFLNLADGNTHVAIYRGHVIRHGNLSLAPRVTLSPLGVVTGATPGNQNLTTEHGLFLKGLQQGYGFFMDENGQFCGNRGRAEIHMQLLSSLHEIEKMRRTVPGKRIVTFINT